MNLSKIILLLLIFCYIYSQSTGSINVDSLLEVHENYILSNNLDSAKYIEFKLMKAGEPIGYYFVGIGYFRGLGGYKKNIRLGLKYLHKSAEMGNSLAALRLMEIYGDTSSSVFIDPAYKKLRDPKKAFKYAIMAMKGNHREAIRYVAYAYFTGKGVEKNDSLAVHYMKILADKYNDPLAQVTLGDWFFYGKTSYGVDNELAKKYYSMVANNSYVDPELQARGRIGLFYIKQLPLWAINLTFTSFILYLPSKIYFDVRW